ncbi:MAG: glycosyltransferase, partial [Alphaproteobacteria bacterium]|nr:glycosyltransferase [Alphaproteobacteria bacterium]
SSENTASELARAASSGVIVERARPDFQALLGRAHLSVSQGGYNTVMEVLAAGLRAVVAPYAGGHESEQTLRAGALAERGALQVVAEDELSPERLAAAIDRALAGPPLSAAGIDLGGIPATIALLQDLDGR